MKTPNYENAWTYFGFSDYTLERLSNAMVASGVVNQRTVAAYQFIASLRNKPVAQMSKQEFAHAWKIKNQLNAKGKKSHG